MMCKRERERGGREKEERERERQERERGGERFLQMVTRKIFM